MKDDHVAFDKGSIYLEVISFMILFLSKHVEETTDTHSSPASEDEYIMINIDYDYTIYNNNIIYDNVINNDINNLDTGLGVGQTLYIVGHPGPMDGG